MGAESRLLYDERPLVVIPELAKLLAKQKGFDGLQEALVLQQIHYWAIMNQRAKRNEKNGYYWTYNTFKDWNEQFPFWSLATIKRIFARLEKSGFLVSGRFNKSNINRTKWYRVDHDVLSRMVQNGLSIVSDCDNGRGQNEPLDSVNLTPTGHARLTNEKKQPETNHRLTTENNHRVAEASSKKKPAPKLHSRPIFAAIQKEFGYPEKTDKDPIPNYGKEGKAIDRMLKRGYSEDEILAAWKIKVRARGEFVSMTWVNEDMGKLERPRQASFLSTKEGVSQGVNRKNSDDPDKYVKGKYGHMVRR